MTEERERRVLGFEVVLWIGVEAVRWIGVSARFHISASLSEDGVGRAVGIQTDFALMLASWAPTVGVEFFHGFFPRDSRIGRATKQCGWLLQIDYRI